MYKYTAVFLAVVGLGLSACGTLPEGTEKHGGFFRAVLSPESTDVDSVQNICDSGDAEEFTKNDSSVTFTNMPLTTEGEVPDIVVRAYTITYVPLTGGPALSPHDYPILDTLVVPGGGNLAAQVEMVPLSTKAQFAKWHVETGNNAHFQYRVHYKFFGKNAYGVDINTTADKTITLGDFKNCS